MPDALDNLRLAHLSDLHVGDLITPAHLPQVVDATNALACDLIAVTGDFVDLSLKVLDAVIDAMGRLTAPLGVYFVPGNHDYLDNGPELIRRFKDAGLRLLVNERLAVAVGGCTLTIAGIDWAKKRRDLANLVAQTMRQPALSPGAPPGAWFGEGVSITPPHSRRGRTRTGPAPLCGGVGPGVR